MNEQSFTTTLTFDQTPQHVFDAVINTKEWWSGEITGNTHQLNDEFTYQYKEAHFSRQRIVELIPNQKVVWLVTESKLSFTEDPSEWTGTKISFEITELDSKTQLRFSHIGLNSEIECFEGCSTAWSQLIHQSLASLITTGKSNPVFFG
jgi:Activator of Hsp90 ATPase homolog 1-like protein